MANFTTEQQKQILKQYATLLVKSWPNDKSQLTEQDLYEAKKQLKGFLEVMPISPKAHIGGCVNLARLINLKYGLKGYKLDDFLWGIDSNLMRQYELLDTLKETA